MANGDRSHPPPPLKPSNLPLATVLKGETFVDCNLVQNPDVK